MTNLTLTFDDGPSEHTLDVLAALDRLGAKATFFMVGEAVDRRPDLAREVARRGHEIGNHTYSHPRLDELSASEVFPEFMRCEDALARAGVRRPIIYRPPYGRTNAEVRGIAERALALRECLWDVDPRDWARPGVDAIVRHIWQAPAGAVVLLHDGGGDRSQTVGALRAMARHSEVDQVPAEGPA